MSDPMSREEAQAEARRRWGPSAVVQEGGGLFEVGQDSIFIASRLRMGSGDSWEAAFADADRRTP